MATVAVTEADGDRVADVLLVPLLERQDDGVADGDRELEMVAHPEPLELVDRDGVAVAVAGIVDKPVATVAVAQAVPVRVTDTLAVVDKVLEGDPDALAERKLVNDRDGDPLVLGERVPESVVDAV